MESQEIIQESSKNPPRISKSREECWRILKEPQNNVTERPRIVKHCRASQRILKGVFGEESVGAARQS